LVAIAEKMGGNPGARFGKIANNGAKPNAMIFLRDRVAKEILVPVVSVSSKARGEEDAKDYEERSRRWPKSKAKNYPCMMAIAS